MKADKYIAGSQIAKARGKLKPPLTQLELSRQLKRLGANMDRAAIAKVENGLRGIQDYELIPLAKALKVSVNWLLTGKGR